MKVVKNQVVLLLIITTLLWFSQYTYIPNFSPYLISLGASHKIAGIILGAYGFSQMILRIPLGIWADRVGKNKVFIIAGLAFSLISAVGLWSSQHLGVVLVSRALAGVSATTWISFTVLFSSYYKEKDTIKAISIIFAFCYIGQSIAMLLGSLVAENYSQVMVFQIAVIGAAIGLLLTLKLNEESNYDLEPIVISKQLQQVFKDRNLIRVSLLAICYQVVMFATVYGFTPVYAKNLGASELQLGILSILSILPIAVGSLFNIILVQQKSEKSLITTGFIVIAISVLVIPLINNISHLYISQLFGSFGRGVIFPMLMGLSIKMVPLKQRSASMGFFQSVYGLGMIIGPVLAGFLSDNFGLAFAFVILGIIALIGAILTLMFISQDA